MEILPGRHFFEEHNERWTFETKIIVMKIPHQALCLEGRLNWERTFQTVSIFREAQGFRPRWP